MEHHSATEEGHPVLPSIMMVSLSPGGECAGGRPIPAHGPASGRPRVDHVRFDHVRFDDDHCHITESDHLEDPAQAGPGHLTPRLTARNLWARVSRRRTAAKIGACLARRRPDAGSSTGPTRVESICHPLTWYPHWRSALRPHPRPALRPHPRRSHSAQRTRDGDAV